MSVTFHHHIDPESTKRIKSQKYFPVGLFKEIFIYLMPQDILENTLVSKLFYSIIKSDGFQFTKKLVMEYCGKFGCIKCGPKKGSCYHACVGRLEDVKLSRKSSEKEDKVMKRNYALVVNIKTPSFFTMVCLKCFSKKFNGGEIKCFLDDDLRKRNIKLFKFMDDKKITLHLLFSSMPKGTLKSCKGRSIKRHNETHGKDSRFTQRPISFFTNSNNELVVPKIGGGGNFIYSKFNKSKSIVLLREFGDQFIRVISEHSIRSVERARNSIAMRVPRFSVMYKSDKRIRDITIWLSKSILCHDLGEIRNVLFISFSTDGNTDDVCQKLDSLHIKYINENNELKISFLDCILSNLKYLEVNTYRATSKKLLDSIIAYLRDEEIDLLEKGIGFEADTTNKNSGEINGLLGEFDRRSAKFKIVYEGDPCHRVSLGMKPLKDYERVNGMIEFLKFLSSFFTGKTKTGRNDILKDICQDIMMPSAPYIGESGLIVPSLKNHSCECKFYKFKRSENLTREWDGLCDATKNLEKMILLLLLLSRRRELEITSKSESEQKKLKNDLEGYRRINAYLCDYRNLYTIYFMLELLTKKKKLMHILEKRFITSYEIAIATKGFISELDEMLNTKILNNSEVIVGSGVGESIFSGFVEKCLMTEGSATDFIWYFKNPSDNRTGRYGIAGNTSIQRNLLEIEVREIITALKISMKERMKQKYEFLGVFHPKNLVRIFSGPIFLHKVCLDVQKLCYFLNTKEEHVEIPKVLAEFQILMKDFCLYEDLKLKLKEFASTCDNDSYRAYVKFLLDRMDDSEFDDLGKVMRYAFTHFHSSVQDESVFSHHKRLLAGRESSHPDLTIAEVRIKVFHTNFNGVYESLKFLKNSGILKSSILSFLGKQRRNLSFTKTESYNDVYKLMNDKDYLLS